MNILIISFLFAPNNDIGALRPTKLAKYMIKHGHTVDVISYGCRGNDSLAVPKGLRFHYTLNHISSNPSHKSSNLKIKKRSVVFIQNLKELYRNVLNLKSNQTFVEFCISTFEKHLIDNQYDFILTTYGPLASILSGIKIKKKFPFVNWVCDFRDPIVTEDTPFLLKTLYSCYQTKACSLADKITLVSHGYSRRIVKKRFIYKSCVIPNGFDKDDVPNFTDEICDKIQFTYTGSLYEGKRKIEPFFKALNELIIENKIEKRKIVFNYAGKDFCFLLSQAIKYNLQDILINCGLLNRSDCLCLEANSDFLILSSWNRRREEGVIPGKFLEYMLFNKPIIALVDGNLKNSEIGLAIKKGNLGITYERSCDKKDFVLLKSYIEQQYNHFVNKENFCFNPNSDYINDFNYENITNKIEKFAKLINDYH